MPLAPLEIFLALLIAIIAAIVQGTVGFGASMLSGPWLLLIDRDFLPGPIVATGLILSLLLSFRHLGAADMRGVQSALFGRIFGIIPAVYAVGVLTDRQFSGVVAILLLCAIALSWAGWHLNPTRRNVFFAGIVSGFTGTLAAAGGPPVALVYQRSATDKLRGTMSYYFVGGGIMSLIALWYGGHFGARELALTAILLPGMGLGYYLSQFTAPLVDAERTRVAVLTVSTVAVAVVLWKALA